jgi:hypothetical protein
MSLEPVIFGVLFLAVGYLSWRLDKTQRYATYVAAQSAFQLIVVDNLVKKLVEKDICKESDIFEFGSPIIKIFEQPTDGESEKVEDSSK